MTNLQKKSGILAIMLGSVELNCPQIYTSESGGDS